MLFVDGDEGTRELFASQVGEHFDVLLAATAEEAEALLLAGEAPLVVCDYVLGNWSGVEFLRRVRHQLPDVMAILVSAYQEMDALIEAINSGLIFRFVLKPWRPEDLLLLLQQAFERLDQSASGRERLDRLEALNRYLLDGEGDGVQVTAVARPMLEVLDTVERVASTAATVLLQGESGTGKELLARLIHQRSPRASGPLIAVNCGALADALLESELFGHERGSFTGAERRHVGKFELAEGGTLFLDEVGDVSPRLQVMLLRVLQERRFERVGGSETIEVDVRVLAATHRPLARLVEEGRFREDLYYRLSVFPISVPPLRERPEDIPVLAERFLGQQAPALAKRVTSIAPDAMRLLREYSWPGNVRELQNVIERATILSDGPAIDFRTMRAVLGTGLLPGSERAERPVPDRVNGRALLPTASSPSNQPAWRERLTRERRRRFEHALEKAGGNLSQAARILGLKRSPFLDQARKAGLL